MWSFWYGRSFLSRWFAWVGLVVSFAVVPVVYADFLTRRRHGFLTRILQLPDSHLWVPESIAARFRLAPAGFRCTVPASPLTHLAPMVGVFWTRSVPSCQLQVMKMTTARVRRRRRRLRGGKHLLFIRRPPAHSAPVRTDCTDLELNGFGTNVFPHQLQVVSL